MSCEGPVGVRAGDSLTLGVGPVAGEASMRMQLMSPWWFLRLREAVHL